MDSADHEYDIALSFMAQDEPLAMQLADHFEGRLRVFLYSRKQEQLAGTDGEKSFNDVFGRQARLVVVLYRDGWGQTPWTRIEETAIRNRAFDEGYDFVVFIPLDDRPSVPRWLPRSQLWIGLSRWGVPGAASVIDARVQELGGEPQNESLEAKAGRVERALGYESRRAQYLGSNEGVRGANASFEQLRESLLAAITRIQAAAPSLQLQHKATDRQIAVLSTGPALLIAWRNKYINTLDESHLEASAWNGHPPFPGVRFYEEPSSLGALKLQPDLGLDDGHAWMAKTTQGSRLLSGTAAAEHILDWWLEKYAMPKSAR